MENHLNDGQSLIAKNQIEIERLLELVPAEDRGLLFSRLFANFHPQENTRMLEVGFALEWAKLNNNNRSQCPILQRLLAPEDDDNCTHLIPKSGREWEVAQFAVATFIQWLPTSIGTSFLASAFKRGGGEFHYKLPVVESEN